MEKIWFITGSSRGLGRSLTEAVLKNGAQVAATARNPQQLDDLKSKYLRNIRESPEYKAGQGQRPQGNDIVDLSPR